ncbi:hypothetical protein [Thioclava indica]|uniref:Uncharacterized protein n=1 Tax=Thioclava indica TaxID=1353528 RepID=A0A074JE46_9RHOB|nr:hypothetical protein [Thioclava indica]KEO53868.1 hypothetical protein DT23_06775 [Thioclava indica]
MLYKMIALSFGFVALILLGGRSFAQEATCAARDDLVAQLHTRYFETRRAVALAANNSVLEVFAAESGSWTILVTEASGLSCLIASGEAFETVRDSLPAMGAPT